MNKSKPKTSKGGVWQRLLDALAKDMGKIISNEKLIKVSGQHNYARRVRELRAEGWDIVYSPSFGRGEKDGTPMCAVNVRTIDNIDLAALQRMPFDGRSY